MSYQARIHHLKTGRFLLHCQVQADSLHEAENVAISKGALAMTLHPREMDVRHLHQCADRAVANAAAAGCVQP